MGSDITLGYRVEDELPDPDGNQTGPLAKVGDPVAIPRSLLRGSHIHNRGMSGCGKTSIVGLPHLLQMMEFYDLVYATPKGKKTLREKDPIVVIDLGGDRALFHAARTHATKLGRTFRYFSFDPERSFGFNLFQSVKGASQRVIRLSNLWLEGLNLDAANGAADAQFFSQQGLVQLQLLASLALENSQSGQEVTLKDIERFLSEKENVIPHADQIVTNLKLLMHYPQLSPEKDDPNVINMRDAIRNREVIFFSCPLLGEATSARMLCGLALYTLIDAAMEIGSEVDPNNPYLPAPHTFVMIDEFASLCGPSYAAVLAQARKHVTLLQLNQTTEQLKIQKNFDLASMVRDNCAVKIYHTITGKNDIEELQSYSKETRDTLRTTREPGSVLQQGISGAGGASDSEYLSPLLRRNTISDVSNTSDEFFVIINDGKQHREPIRTRQDRILSEAEFVRYNRTPLPLVEHPGQDVSEKEAGQVPLPNENLLLPLERKHRETPTGERIAWLQALREILREKVAGE